MRVTLLTLDPLEHDSRVLRMARAFRDSGHAATVVGLAPCPSGSDNLDIVALPSARSALRIRAGLVLRHAPASVAPWTARSFYWLSRGRRRAHDALLAARPELLIAADWKTLPIALAARRRLNCRVIYDSHEFATGEFADTLAWRLLVRRHVQEIERRGIAEADAVITVSDGLADRLATLYGLSRRPTVVRNIPDTAPMPFRATGASISVLYQGLIAPNRGLEATIASVRDWREDRSLLIRGFGRPDYISRLKSLAASHGARGRIAFAPAVPPDAIVAAAHGSDIGLFGLPGRSAQTLSVLPNKIFEYMAAGLALAVSDLPEMRRVVTAHGCGALIGAVTSDAISAVVNGFDRETIDACKKASLAAASEQTFQAEFAKVSALVETLQA